MPRIIYTPTIYLRKDKRLQNGNCPVYVRFQRINGKEPKFPLGISVTENDWDETTKRPKSLALKIITDKKVAQIEQQILNAIANDIEITSGLLKEFVNGKERAELRSFYDYFDEYVSKGERLGKLKESTTAGYKVTRNALKAYRSEIRITEINTKLLEGFEKFLIKRANELGRGEVKGSRSNRIKHINAVLNYIERQGITVENPYSKGDLIVPQADKNDVFLDHEELKKLADLIYDLEVGTKEYRILCLFLFSCVTGLRLNDALNLKWENIDVDTSKDYFILSKNTQKTEVDIDIPLSELGEQMMLLCMEDDLDNVEPEKYMFHRFSGTLINKTLKTLAAQVGIDKNISFNCSRRTFITLAKAQGLDDYSLMKYAGHKSIRMTERYMKWSKSLAIQTAEKIKLFQIKDYISEEADE